MRRFPRLEQLAGLLRRLRDFFYARGFFEVETPLISNEIIPEQHIEPLRIEGGGFLQASPELHMKRLLAAGAKAIFQVTHAFRAGERGRLHNPEFTIVEWYRAGDNMSAGMDMLDELMQSLLGTPAAARTTYANVFRKHVGLCPHAATIDELAAAVKSSAGLLGSSDSEPPVNQPTNRDEWLNLLLAKRVESNLGAERPEIIYHYPATQASLAKVVRSELGYDVAERFELYYRGVEMANGFHELTDAAEQRRRLHAENAARIADGRPALPLPESLLAAMDHGLPAATGVALGFDRLAMMTAGAQSIAEVVAFMPQTE